MASMGDYFSPKRRDVVDRLRRRLELYRSRQHWSRSRFEPGINGVYGQQRQDTTLLRQRWLECKAKKAAKHTKSSKDFGGAQSGDQILTPKLKRKLDSGNNATSGAAGDNANSDSVFGEDRDSPKVKAQCTNNISQNREDGLSSVSVQIVQQINAQKDQGQTIQTNVTVSSTVKGGAAHGGNPTPGSTSSNIHTSTNVECKQEPQDNPCSGASHNNPFGIDDVDELTAILETLEREEGEIPPELIKELDKLGEATDSVTSVGSDHDVDTDFKDPLFGPGSSKGSPSMFGDPSTPFDSRDTQANANIGNMPPNGQSYPTAQANVPVTPSTPGMINMVEATGPAAETLKQMAAQHQTPDNTHFSMTQSTSFTSDNVASDNFSQPRRPGVNVMPQHGSAQFPRGYPNHQAMAHQGNGQHQPNNMYTYNQQQMPQMARQGVERTPTAVPPMGMHIKQDPSLSYGCTKPLSHYNLPQMQQQAQANVEAMPNQGNPPSSLKQLQDQVQSHFPGGQGQVPVPGSHHPNSQAQTHMQLSQNQQMQLSRAKGQHMQMSQTQQLQIHSDTASQGHQISLAQQQSFTMSQQQHSQNMPTHTQQPQNPQQAQYMNEQMKMEMMQEKMRRQLHEQKLREQMMEQQRQAQMQGYMNRPPPEYKMGSGHAHPGDQGNVYPSNNMAGHVGNPLQPIQNMVSQTSQGHQAVSNQIPQYSIVKQEVGQPIQRQTMAGHVPPHMSTTIQGHRRMPQDMAGVPASQTSHSMNMNAAYGQHQRQPPMYQPGRGMHSHSLANGSVHNQPPNKPSAPTYTSAIMRGQRPPNVNVGPEGLNISQQRPHASEWPRQSIMPQNAAGQPRPGIPLQNNMMHYGGYPGQPGQSVGMTMQGMDMQPSNPHQRTNTAPAQMAAQQQHQQGRTMIQHNNAQLQQQMHMRHQTPHGATMSNVNMSQSLSVTSRPTQQGFPGNSGTGAAEFPLDFLDNPQGVSTDFFESNASDFNIIEEIFGK